MISGIYKYVTFSALLNDVMANVHVQTLVYDGTKTEMLWLFVGDMFEIKVATVHNIHQYYKEVVICNTRHLKYTHTCINF